MGEGTTPGCFARSAAAAGAADAAEAADAETPGWKLAGIEAAIEMLRATRTRRPARSISISVRLVSSSSKASSRMSALSSRLKFAADLVSGLLAMLLIRNSWVVTADASGFDVRFLMSGFCFGANFGGKAVDREPVAVDAEAAKRSEGGFGGEGMMPETLASVNVADVHFDGWNFHRDQRVVQRDRGVGIAAGIDDDAHSLAGMRLVDEIDQLALAIGLPAIGLEAELRRGLRAQFLDIGELCMAVGLGFASPQHVEVRTVEHINRRCRGLGHPDSSNWGRVGRGVIGNNGG